MVGGAMNTVEYTKAYTELNCLLSIMPKTYIEKIPLKLRTLIKSSSDEKYSIDISKVKRINEYDFSPKTKSLIAVLKYNYWSTGENEKRNLSRKFNENEKKYQEELSEKYNADNLFKSKKEETIIENTVETAMIIHQDLPLYKRIFIKIKEFFSINRK